MVNVDTLKESEIRMREIKFRAWDKLINDWNDEIILEINGKIKLYDGIETFDDDVSDFILMQFTGLKDKNGKEIYEGDIVKWYWGVKAIHIGSVFMRLGCWYLSNVKELGYIKQDKLEVIGNIYENPELVE